MNKIIDQVSVFPIESQGNKRVKESESLEAHWEARFADLELKSGQEQRAGVTKSKNIQ